MLSLAFTSCKDACEDFTCGENQNVTEDVLTGICVCLCDIGFAGPDCTLTQEAFDQQLITEYLTENNIEAESLESGLHYVITDSYGLAPGPSLSDEVVVSYKGYLLSGLVFDEPDEQISFPLENVIEGWQQGIPLFAKGDKGKLFIPSALGYGGNPPPGAPIPANAVLVFDIELHDY